MAKSLQAVGRIAHITENKNFSVVLTVIGGNFDALNNLYTVAFAYKTSPHRTCKTVEVGYSQVGNAAFFSQDNYVIYAHRAVRELSMTM